MKATKAEIKSELWRRGNLSWKLHDDQRVIYDRVKNTQSIKNFFNIHRRRGKSTVFFIDAIEYAIKNENAIIHYFCPTFNEAKKIILPIYRIITADAPEEVRPVWYASDGCFVIPSSGSKIHLVGTENRSYERARGTRTDRGYIDEAGFCDDLKYIVDDILIPQTITTSGKLFIFSTPPPTPAHDFYFMCMEAKSKDDYCVLDFASYTAVSDDVKAQYIAEAGGEKSATVRREYFCDFLTDPERAVLPEFDDEKEKKIVIDFPRPDYYDWIGALDPALNDFTAYIIGYYDFINAKYVIENEMWFNKMNTEKIADGIKELESETFDTEPKLRVSDTDSLLICDLNELHKLQFVPTRKDDKEAQLNYLRVLIQNERIVINPRCVNLIRQCKTAIWNRQRTQYERTDKEGHFDLIDALVYFVRNTNTANNPYPIIERYDRDNMHVNFNRLREKRELNHNIKKIFEG